MPGDKQPASSRPHTSATVEHGVPGPKTLKPPSAGAPEWAPPPTAIQPAAAQPNENG